MPQVALKRAEALLKYKHEVFVIEYREIAWSYVVQRNKMKDLLGENFISLGWTDKEEIRDNFEEIVSNINPDVIHMEEIPEKFIFGIREEHAKWLYRKDRPYKIIETTHTSTFDVEQKKYFPDKFMFVSEYSEKEYRKFNIPSSVVEYPIEKLEKNKSQSIKKLELDPEYLHVLNVGLFTEGKNQGYIFELAKILEDYKIHFHFVGNQAENFSNYWKPLMDKKLDNCFIYGERNDVELFYQASDLLIHPSLLELNPLAIKEATSYDLPVFLNDLDTYNGSYDLYKNVKYLKMNSKEDSKMILDNFNIKRKDDISSFGKSLSNEYESLLNEKGVDDVKTSAIIPSTKILEDEKVSYNISFVDGARVEILSEKKYDFDVEIYDKENNELVYKTILHSNNWCTTNIKYYKEYKVNVSYNGSLKIVHNFNLENKKVLIQLDSKSIGDTLAWFPYVEEFRKKHNCEIYCVTFWNSWFVKEYKDITFLEPGFKDKIDIYARYVIGWYQPVEPNRNPIDYKTIPLQKTATDILGLEYKETRPKITIPEGVRPIKEKYVCLAQFSTASTKHWHYPYKDSNKGWQILVDWLNIQGYKVMVISKQKTSLKNIIDRTGDFPIEHRINEIKWSEFFIGIGSGLSWLAWAVGKKVVMISGFSNPICEFQTNNINVHNFNVCNGCFNKYMFDRGDWNWCPEHKDTDRQFECSTNITPKMVIDRIVNSKLISDVKDFEYESYDSNITLNEDDVTVNYIKNENKIEISYSNTIDTPEINVTIKDKNKVYHIISDTVLSSKHIVWCIPNTVLHEKTNKIIVSFHEKTKFFDIKLDI